MPDRFAAAQVDSMRPGSDSLGQKCQLHCIAHIGNDHESFLLWGMRCCSFPALTGLDQRQTNQNIYIYIHTHTYIYIFIHTHIDKHVYINTYIYI